MDMDMDMGKSKDVELNSNLRYCMRRVLYFWPDHIRRMELFGFVWFIQLVVCIFEIDARGGFSMDDRLEWNAGVL